MTLLAKLFPLTALLALAANAPAQILEAKLTAPDGSAGDGNGSFVAVAPGWAFCAAPFDENGQIDTGSVYVFHDDGTGWAFAQKLIGSNPKAWMNLGTGLSVSGSWMVASSPFDSPVPGNSGSADVYQLQGGSWVHTQELIPGNPAWDYHVGTSASLAGERLVLGASEESTRAGSAYVFELSGATWIEKTKLLASDPAPFSEFGFDVALEGDTLVVGAPRADNGVAQSDRGAAYVFTRGASEWSFVQKLVASDAADDDLFGTSVDVDGTTIVVGSPWHSHGTQQEGALYVFERVGSLWAQSAELQVSDPRVTLNFGQSVDLEGDLLVSGAHRDDDHGVNSGSAYVFRRNASNAWLQIAKILAPDAAQQAEFGSDVALAGGQVLVGAYRDDGACPGAPLNCDAGAAYVFDIAPAAVQYGSCPTQGPCGNHDDFGGCACSSGAGGELAAAGSASVSSDDLRFEARWLPANKLGLFFMGGMPTSMPFGDGQLCVTSGGAGVWRFNPAQSSGADGVLTLGPGVVGLSNSLPPGGHIQAGQIWHFQAWFRDPSGPCGQGSNMTNAVRVMFEL
jgi:hypothetical protein